MPCQLLTLTLDGITAGDYLSRVRDPEPPALGAGLGSIAVHAHPLGDTVEAELCWDHGAPPPQVAARAAGLVLTPEVEVSGNAPRLRCVADAAKGRPITGTCLRRHRIPSVAA